MSDKVKPWDERYSGSEFYYGREPNDFLKLHADQIRPKGKVLCLAEGEGRNAVYLASLGFQVVAVDQSTQGLKKVKQLALEAGVQVETIAADLDHFEIKRGFWDGIISIWCHVPPALRKKLHQHVVTGLAPEGILILESYHPRQLDYKTGGPPTAELMMTMESLKQELKGLHLNLLQEIDREVQEGKGHQGKSAVTQCLAQKFRVSY